MCELRIIEVIFLICLLAHEYVRKYELHFSRVLLTLQNCARCYIKYGRTGFKGSHFNAFNPTDMLQNSDFTYSY